MNKLASMALVAATVGIAASAHADVMQLRITTDNVSTPDVYALTVNDIARVNVRPDQLNGTTGANGDQAIAGTTTTGTLIRSLVSFNLAGWAASVAPAGSTIQINSVSLTLNLNGATSTGTIHDVGIRMSTFGSFTSTTNWASLGGTVGTDIVPPESVLLGRTTVQINEKNASNIAVMKPFTFDSTENFVDYFSDTVNGSNKVMNLIFWNNSAEDGVDLVRFATRTGAGANGDPVTYSPVFTVDYTVAAVPEAASLGLLGVGALAMIRRRR